MRKSLPLTLVAVLLILASVSAAFAAPKPEDVFVFDGKANEWVLKSGGEPEGTPWGGYIDRGLWFYAVNPDADDAAKGMEAGILLHDAKAKKYSFLPFDKELIGGVQNVEFSPNGKTIVVAVHMSRFFGQLMVYDVETLGREPKKTFEMAYADIFFVDNVRFALTLIDNKIQRPEAAGLWGTSAALYDPSHDEGYVVLKGATATENFAVTGLSGETEITVNVTSVKSEKDWEDTEKQQNSEITVEVPAAG